MGSKEGKFKEETMNEFEAATPFNRAEVYHAFKIFQQCYDEYVKKCEEEPKPMFVDDYIDADVAIPIEDIYNNLPVLKVNPFGLKMCQMFATSGNNMMTFVDFLDMVSAFSPKNSTQQKIFHAFQIFDIDGDGIISRNDLIKMIDMITDQNMSSAKKDQIITAVFEEVNKECNSDGLSTEDFHYAISRSPDFASTFSFQL